MSKPENFLMRWSQRKLAKGEQAAPERDEQQAQTENRTEAAPAQDVAASGPEEKPFDPASLPSIESIDASTDITAFLRPGVPSELSRAALRRAWSADPAIRDFVGLVENGWDFNDSQAMAGFGPITPGEVARLAAQMLGDLPVTESDAPVEAAKNAALDATGVPDSAAALPASPRQTSSVEDAAQAKTDSVRRNTENDASQKDSDS